MLTEILQTDTTTFLGFVVAAITAIIAVINFSKDDLSLQKESPNTLDVPIRKYTILSVIFSIVTIGLGVWIGIIQKNDADREEKLTKKYQDAQVVSSKIIRDQGKELLRLYKLFSKGVISRLEKTDENVHSSTSYLADLTNITNQYLISSSSKPEIIMKMVRIGTFDSDYNRGPNKRRFEVVEFVIKNGGSYAIDNIQAHINDNGRIKIVGDEMVNEPFYDTRTIGILKPGESRVFYESTQRLPGGAAFEFTIKWKNIVPKFYIMEVAYDISISSRNAQEIQATYKYEGKTYNSSKDFHNQSPF